MFLSTLVRGNTGAGKIIGQRMSIKFTFQIKSSQVNQIASQVNQVAYQVNQVSPQRQRHLLRGPRSTGPTSSCPSCCLPASSGLCSCTFGRGELLNNQL